MKERVYPILIPDELDGVTEPCGEGEQKDVVLLMPEMIDNVNPVSERVIQEVVRSSVLRRTRD